MSISQGIHLEDFRYTFLDQILGRGGGFQQLAPGSQLAWRRTDFIDMNSNHRFFWALGLRVINNEKKKIPLF